MMRTLCASVAFVALLAGGCAGEKDQRLGQLNGRDPLLGEKIPPPNVPTGRYGLKDGHDPLMRADAGRTNRDNTPAALSAARRDTEQSELRIPDRRTEGEVASRSASGADGWKADLERAGARVFAATRTETGGYEVRVQVPHISSGATTGYVGTGNTPTLAMKDAYDQVRADRK